eukprot:gene10837-biopygen22843
MGPMDGTHSCVQKTDIGAFWEHFEQFWSILDAKSRRKWLRERVKQTDIRAPAQNGSHGWHPQLCTKNVAATRLRMRHLLPRRPCIIACRVSFDDIAHQDHINVAHKIAHQGKRYKWGGGGGRRGER